MKINYELLFFIIKSRLFTHLSFSLPLSAEGEASPFLSLLEQAGCARPSSLSVFQISTLLLLPLLVPSWVWRSATAVF